MMLYLVVCHVKFRLEEGQCFIGGVGVGTECKTQGGEMLLMLVVGWRTSALKSEEAGCFCKVHM